MCPDPALLVAYLDGTLFSRDASAVDQHLESCSSCTALLADMRRHREAAERSRSSRVWIVAAGIAAIAIVGIGSWVLLPGSSSEPNREIAPARSDADRRPAAVTRTAPATAPVTPPAKPDPVATARPVPVADTKAPPKPIARTEKASRATEKPARDATAPAVSDAASTDRVPDPIQVDGGVILRGRNANRRILWRTRDLVIEHSTDGGATWAAEHTADRPIRAGAFVNTSVVWLVGENGLVLRRTANGWFGTSPPADATITAVRASSPSKATVTLEDGRVFSTENGGVTWSAP